MLRADTTKAKNLRLKHATRNAAAKHAHEDVARPFDVRADDEAMSFEAEYIASATEGQSVAEDARDEFSLEETGGPFSIEDPYEGVPWLRPGSGPAADRFAAEVAAEEEEEEE